MTIQFYKMPKSIQAGITLKNSHAKEYYNMALHSCISKNAVIENRQHLAKALNVPIEALIFANQTHSANFQKVTKAHLFTGSTSIETAFDETDAMYTFEDNLVMTSMSADCVPILFYNEEAHLIGAIHSGWSGTVKEISYKLMNYLKHEEQIDLSKMHVHIGYSICAEKFEVDADVANQFLAFDYAKRFVTYNEETKKYHIDNQYVVKTQCMLAGVLEENIKINRECTYKLEEGFSYRQDRNCGRHVSFIVQRKVD